MGFFQKIKHLIIIIILKILIILNLSCIINSLKTQLVMTLQINLMKFIKMQHLLCHQNKYRRSLEMSLITCKIELKFKWTKYCLLSATGNVHTNERPKIIWWNYIVTDINYIVTLSKLLRKGFEIRGEKEETIDLLYIVLKLPHRQLPPGQLPPRIIVSRIIAP